MVRAQMNRGERIYKCCSASHVGTNVTRLSGKAQSDAVADEAMWRVGLGIGVDGQPAAGVVECNNECEMKDVKGPQSQMLDGRDG
jgi:hypothetical protein